MYTASTVAFIVTLFLLLLAMLHRLAVLLTFSASSVLGGVAETMEPFQLPLSPGGPYNSHGLITLGEPLEGAEPQTLRTLFDTGTFNLWVVSPEFPYTGVFKPYDGSKSSKYKTENVPLSENWAGSFLHGRYSEDTLKIGSEERSVTLTDQQFGELTSITEDIKDVAFDSYDAILGLDLISPEAVVGPVPPLLRLADKYKPLPTFGFYIDRFETTHNKLVFGDLDRELYKGDLVDHPVVQRTFITYDTLAEPIEDVFSDQLQGLAETSRQTVYRGWNVQITKFQTKAPNQDAQEFPGRKFARIMTRSTALLIGPEEFINPVNEAIFKDLSWVTVNRDDYSFDCPANRQWLLAYQTMPDVTIYIDDQPYHFRPQDYISRIPDRNYCRSSFVGLNVPYYVIGEPFITKYYTRFDYDRKVVQMALKLPDDVDLHLSTLPEEVISAILERTQKIEAAQVANTQQVETAQVANTQQVEAAQVANTQVEAAQVANSGGNN